ncbi:translation initiation factor IF-2 [Candidatus Daviesbacteria bacterium]|nr:translation initiation factor IF-2 [Candidatus Daviesbacteria bacterium]
MEEKRPPIVTILGHVDHGKTTLLDFIRKAAVAKGEHGGITQAIGAYQIGISEKGKVLSEEPENKKNLSPEHSSLITFIDTPGHAAFEKMRSRGAKVADIAVLVVAIDDGLMPQTLEAIKHIKEAKVPMIVAVNKVDLPGINKTAQMEKIKKQLSDREVLIEEYGGDVPIVQVSAKIGLGVDKLLEMIQLVADVNEFKGDPDLPATGVVVESKLDKFKGPIATVIILNGTLKKGENIIIGGVRGKVRGLIDYLGKQLSQAGPSTPIEISGLEGVPDVGAELGRETSTKEEKQAVVVSILDRLKKDETSVLKVVIRADVAGSLEAIEDALSKFNEEAEHLKIIASSTGDINESDIKLASSTSAIVIGFNVKASNQVMKLAETEAVLLRTYNIIYELIEEMEDVVEGMLKVGALEEIFGTAQIVAEFPYGKNEKIAGCKILDGVFTKGPRIKILRGEEIIGETKIKSLKKVREEVNKVEKSDECGMMFEPKIDFTVGDLIQSFRTI